jgi:hypothetical protein
VTNALSVTELGCQPRGEVRPLRGEAALDVIWRSSPVSQPRSLRDRRALDQPDLIALLGQTALDELYGFDAHEGNVIAFRVGKLIQDHLPDMGMDDLLEVAQRGSVVEHDCGESRAIEVTVGVEDASAETLAHRIERRTARRGRRAGKDVGVDDGATQLAEHPPDI